MRAVRLVQFGHPLEMQDIPVPVIGPKEVLVRVRAAGICHSDVHLRAGFAPQLPIPRTLGHEIAGFVERVGDQVTTLKPGARVCLHYILSCGECEYCLAGHDNFCSSAEGLGAHRDGGYAEFVALPVRSVLPLPDEIPFEQGAIAMCSSATAFHALNKAGVRPGESVAIFGAGGLGMSAIQLARAFGAMDIYAVDIDEGRLKLAEAFGAIPVNNTRGDAVAQLKDLTRGKGVHVALELIGLATTMRQTVESVGCLGRAVMVGLNNVPFLVESQPQLLGKEPIITGSRDHPARELPVLLELIRRRVLDLSRVVTHTLPLDAGAINDTMDRLGRFEGGQVRAVITP